ncbi:hypothetical protein FACS189426_05020 [Bacteroidia bacterium]|nr:hypothetical protein FACS189426_05020 [Bacteroidia bacterium]
MFMPNAVTAGISITVITRPSESYKDSRLIQECIALLQSAVSIIIKSNIHQKYIIIDNRLVWYGSINLLSFGSSEESIMRLESRELAAELETMMK